MRERRVSVSPPFLPSFPHVVPPPLKVLQPSHIIGYRLILVYSLRYIYMCKLCKPRNKGKCLKLKGTGLKDISYSFNRSINVIYQSNMIFIIIMLCQREGFKKKFSHWRGGGAVKTFYSASTLFVFTFSNCHFVC